MDVSLSVGVTGQSGSLVSMIVLWSARSGFQKREGLERRGPSDRVARGCLERSIPRPLRGYQQPVSPGPWHAKRSSSCTSSSRKPIKLTSQTCHQVEGRSATCRVRDSAKPCKVLPVDPTGWVAARRARCSRRWRGWRSTKTPDAEPLETAPLGGIRSAAKPYPRRRQTERHATRPRNCHWRVSIPSGQWDWLASS